MNIRNIDGVSYIDLSDDLSDDAITACQEWHAGMGCPLYAVRSSGLVRWGEAWRLRGAVEYALDLAVANGADTVGLEDLHALLDDLDAVEDEFIDLRDERLEYPRGW